MMTTPSDILIKLRATIRPASRTAFLDWQATLNRSIAGISGFISLEFVVPSQQNNQRVIIQRFSDMEKARLWRQSLIYRQLLKDLEKLAIDHEIEEITGDLNTLPGGVTEVFVAQISPEKEEEFLNWNAKIHRIESKFPGFQGTYIQSPTHSHRNQWITLLQFDTLENLEKWLLSSEREEILKESNSLMTSLETHRVTSPYAGWFSTMPKTKEIPSVWKQTMLVLLVLYPIVMLERNFLIPVIAGLGQSVGTFIANAISVSLIAFPAMPVAIWLLSWWLSPGREQRAFKVFFGTLLVLFLYLVEILLFKYFYN